MNTKNIQKDLFGTKWWNSAPVLYQDLGLTPPPLAVSVSLGDFSLEQLPKLNADYIFVIDGDPAATKNPILNNPVWKATKAYKQGHVFIESAQGTFF